MVGRVAGVTPGWALPISARPAPTPQCPPPPRPIWVDEMSQNRRVPQPRMFGKHYTLTPLLEVARVSEKLCTKGNSLAILGPTSLNPSDPRSLL